MYIAWEDNFSVGIDLFDQQHKELFAIINRLVEGIKDKKASDTLAGIFERLVNYTATHFADEERAMRVSKYPGYEEHRQEHEDLRNKVMEFYTDFKAGRNFLTLDLLGFLVGWLKVHIAQSDRRYGPYLKRKVFNPSPFIEWDEKYSVGVDTFDAQHRKIFDLVNTLYEGIKQKREVLQEVFEDLLQYTQTHFAAEEKAMEAAGYPDLEHHKKEHEALVKKVLEYYDKYKNDGGQMHLEMMGFLVNWLNDHIAISDKAYGPFLADNSPELETSSVAVKTP